MADLSKNRLSAEALAALVGDLSDDKRELLELLLKEQGINLSDAVILPSSRKKLPGDAGIYMPVSFAQQRMWFLDQLEPGSPYYNIPSAVRVRGHVVIGRLSDCLNEIIRRHEILRTTFSTQAGEPIQVIHPSLSISLPLVDLSTIPEFQRFDEAVQLASIEARQPFDLSQGPLMRAKLFCLAEDDFLFILTMHHIISDGWSMGVFIRELATLYEAFTTGRRSSLEELPIQYADYSDWQRQWLHGEELEKQLVYWQERLENKPPVLELPTDHPRPAVLSSRGAAYSKVLSKPLADALRIKSQQMNATLFMTLLAAFKILLSRYTGQVDITVGTPVANRSRPEFEGLIGIFINTLALRSDLSGKPTFREFLERVRTTALDAYDHQDVPFEVVVEKLQIERDLSHNPVFQVMLILQNAPQQAIQLSGITMETVEVHSGTSTFDITMIITEMPVGLHVTIEYNTDLFEPDMIQRLVAHFEILLGEVVKNPDQSIASIPIMPAAEKEQILQIFSRGEDEPIEEGCFLYQEILEVAKDRSDSPAVVWEEQNLTYQELIESSTRLASVLQEYGVGPEVLVGVCLPRSRDMIIALLAILQAGGAYLPLDPNYPVKRLEWMLEDSRAPVIITLGQMFESHPNLIELFSRSDLNLIQLDVDEAMINLKHVSDWKEPELLLDNLAYVIYTSGSTGRPKGVQITHRSMINFVTWAQKVYEIQGTDRVLQFASLNFDTAVEEIYPTLISGATLVLRPEPLMSFTEFRNWLAHHDITVLDLPTAYWHAWVSDLSTLSTGDIAESPIPGCVRLVIVGGERALPEYFDLWQKITAPANSNQTIRWLNTYGPTEATVVCLSYEQTYKLRSTLLEDATSAVTSTAPAVVNTSLPVGRPIANTQVIVVDSNEELAPIGIPGELWIGGAGLARGYLNQPVLTAERFVSPPEWMRFANQNEINSGLYGPGIHPGRFYRTGDRVRFLPDGNIDFLGRIDDQIKLRGFRIELGEIEAVLAEDPSVREVAVLLTSKKTDHDPSGTDEQGSTEGQSDKKLVAFISLNQNAAETDLKSFAKSKLPDYMVPALFIFLPALPLTPNGKVDRKALAARLAEYSGDELAEQTQDLTKEHIAPRTPVEQKLSEIWEQLLNISKIGIYDNFFDLGGHSLLATQLVSRLRSAFNIDLPLRSLFENPTIAGLAEQIQENTVDGRVENTYGQGGQNPPDHLIGIVDRDQEIPLSFAQQRLWFLEQFEPGTAAYHIPSLFRLTGDLDLEALRTSINLMVQRHETLRTSIQTIDGTPRQVIMSELEIDLPVVHVESVDRALRLAREDVSQPFNLSRAPLFRVKCFKLAEDETIILFNMHHIIFDGWSTEVVVREIASIYPAILAGEDVKLPEITFQYADFAVWQRQWFEGERLKEQLEYWKAQLQEIPPLLELPTDRPRPSVQTTNGDILTFDLGAQLSEDLDRFCRQNNATLFMTVLATFQVLLSRYSGQTDINVGTPIANRRFSELEYLIGFFVNTLVIRGDLSGEPTFREFLNRVRETALGAYAHQDIPFEMLVKELQPHRDTSHTPLFQVMFVMQNIPITSIQLPELTLSSFEIMTDVALFDLSLIANQGENGLEMAFEYNTDLFNKSTIERMAGHLKVLIKEAISRPDQPLSSLMMLTEIEQRKILLEFNQGPVLEFPISIPEAVQKQALIHPEATAVVYENQSLSYADLLSKAKALARHLMTVGVGPEVLVGICLNRSVEMIIALLAVMEAGGAYLPLDPGYPVYRLDFMLKDSQANVVITSESLLSDHASLAGLLHTPEIDVVYCDIVWNELETGVWAAVDKELPYDKERPYARLNHPDDLAYVIYTSGSTGQPKGVQITYRALANYIAHAQNAFGLQANDRVLQFASLNFDTAAEEIYPTLISGATLVLRPEHLMSFDTFLEWIGENAITFLDLPTAYWHAWVGDIADKTFPDCLRLVVVGGERALGEQYKAWRQAAPEQIRWINTYGPTEATIVCLTYEPQRDWLEKVFPLMPIGKPIANMSVLVVDAHLQLVPIGVPGELWVAGEGLARGYLNQPELTAERFVPAPKWMIEAFAVDKERPNEIGLTNLPTRFYRTGDRVRFLLDGNIDYLGRVDSQVKLRGFRIEPGEIEAILVDIPSVHEAAVLLREDKPGEKQLVAYLSFMNEDALTLSELRSIVKGKLPEYMVPAIFVILPALPLTPSNKIDRKALALLPLEDNRSGQIVSEYLAPRTPTEETLARIWAQVLGIERVGVNANFFELGGDSILGIQVTARANQAGLAISPRHIFEAQTIAELAILAESENNNQTRQIHAEQGLVTGPVPLTPIQRWFFEQDFPDPAHWNQALMFEISQPLEHELLVQTFEVLSSHHDALRMRFKKDEQGWIQINTDQVSNARSDVLDWVDLSHLSGVELTDAIEARADQAHLELNLENGPLLRAVYFYLGYEQTNGRFFTIGRLLIVIHHLVVDAVSWRILIEDLQSIYWQLSGEKLGKSHPDAIRLPPKTTSFQFWARRLEDYAQTTQAVSELDFWLGTTDQPYDSLIPDMPEGVNNEASTDTVHRFLEVERTTELLQEVPTAYKTEINDVLMSALIKAYSIWNNERGSWQEKPGETSLLVALEGHGREDILEDVDISRTVGWFTSIFPVRLVYKYGDTSGDILKSIKEQMRSIPRRGFGYGILRYMNQSFSPRLQSGFQPQIAFNYLGQVGQALSKQETQQTGDELPGRPFELSSDIIAKESSGHPQSGDASKIYLIEITANIAKGRLNVEWMFSNHLFNTSSIERLADLYLMVLEELIEHCLSPDAGGYTTSDFPLARISQDKLDRILTKGTFAKSSTLKSAGQPKKKSNQ